MLKFIANLQKNFDMGKKTSFLLITSVKDAFLCFNLLPVFSLFVLFLGCFGWDERISIKRNVKRIIPVGKLPF